MMMNDLKFNSLFQLYLLRLAARICESFDNLIEFLCFYSFHGHLKLNYKHKFLCIISPASCFFLVIFQS